MKDQSCVYVFDGGDVGLVMGLVVRKFGLWSWTDLILRYGCVLSGERRWVRGART